MKNIIYSNYDLSDAFEETKQFIMEEYPERCTVEVEDTETGKTHMEPSDNEVWDWIYDEDQILWNEIWAEINNYLDDKDMIAVGNIGTWRGSYEGSKTGTFEDIFHAAVKDCDYIELADEDGDLTLKCTHHDSSNYLTIRIITEEGMDYIQDKWEDNWDGETPEAEINKIVYEKYSKKAEVWSHIY